MKLKYWMAGTSVAICVGLAAPALADNVNTNTNNNSNSNTNNTNTQNNSTSSSSATANSNGLTYDLDLNYDASTHYSVDYNSNNTTTNDETYGNGSASRGGEAYGDGSASRGGTVTDQSINGSSGYAASGLGLITATGNGDNRDNDSHNTDGGSVSAAQGGQVDTLASGEDSNAASRGGEIDTVASGQGSQAASRGGEISNDSHNTEGGSISASQGGENEIYGDGSASRGGIAGSTVDSTVGSTVDSNFDSVVADQELRATIVGHDMYAMVDNVNQYNSGNNSVRGNAFAAYSGILNQAWNTGLVANTQAGTNIAASAEINFATNSGAGGQCPGNSCH
jgi:hypothetical protein